MADKTVTIQMPEETWRRLQRVADLTYRSVTDVLVTTLNAALNAPGDIPAELADELAAMHVLSDEALWAAAQPTLSPAEQTRLAQLNHLAGERALTEPEAAEQVALLNAYHRSVLRRAQALAILTQRGHTLSLQAEPQSV
jgi:predicted transcriptional regulator